MGGRSDPVPALSFRARPRTSDRAGVREVTDPTAPLRYNRHVAQESTALAAVAEGETSHNRSGPKYCAATSKPSGERRIPEFRGAPTEGAWRRFEAGAAISQVKGQRER